MTEINVSQETMAELRRIRDQHGVSFAYIADQIVDQYGQPLVVGSIILERDGDSPFVEVTVKEHYDAMCGVMDTTLSPFPCSLRPGHKGEHKYGADYRMRSPLTLPEPGD